MTKRIIIILISVAALSVALYASLCLLSSQTEIYADRPSGRLAKMPIGGEPLFVEVSPGLRFKLDTGSDISYISKNDLARLDSMGYGHERLIYPSFGRDGYGDMDLDFVRVRVSLPLNDYVFETDSAGVVSHSLSGMSPNVIHNVDFVESDSPMSVLGMDFLMKFRIEYGYAESSLSLYFDLPEGYTLFRPMKASKSLLDMPYLGMRFYVDMLVEQKRDDYFIDTGIQGAHVKLPLSERRRTKRRLVSDTIHSFLGAFPALVDNSAWVECGVRAGNHKVYYYDNREEPYAMNPFNVISQDFVLDFPNREILVRPYYDTRPRSVKFNPRICPTPLTPCD